MKENSQNPMVRRAYLVRPRTEFIARMQAAGNNETALSFKEQATVVMTEALQYEGKLEGYRSLILKKCKEAFIADLNELTPEAIFDPTLAPAIEFDNNWTAEEVDTLEIKTTW